MENYNSTTLFNRNHSNSSHQYKVSNKRNQSPFNFKIDLQPSNPVPFPIKNNDSFLNVVDNIKKPK